MVMNKMQNIDNNIVADVATRIEKLITDARANIARAVNLTEVITKFEIGHVIVSVVQEGEVRAAYSKQLLKGVSEILTERLGDGWSVDTLEKCRKFYHAYSKSAALSRKLVKLPETYPFTLSWPHYLILMRIESDEERRFYEVEAQKQNWSVRQLQRQYSSSLYERLALTRNKDEVMRLAQEGQTISKPDDILKNPLTLEFLGLKLDAVYSETKLENAVISKENSYVDLVFYNRLLQCYVPIDLKVCQAAQYRGICLSTEEVLAEITKGKFSL